jgi:hypothetical protein
MAEVGSDWWVGGFARGSRGKESVLGSVLGETELLGGIPLAD